MPVSVGRELLDLPFAEVVRNLALAIAEGQTALDRNSVETLRQLVENNVDIITDVTEVIEPNPITVTIPPTGSILVTGAKVTSSGAPPIRMSLLQAGFLPSFYQFTEAVMEAKLSITMREDRDTQTVARAAAGYPGLGQSRAFAANVDFKSANKYSYAAEGSSVLRVTMKPVPPPLRLEPTVTTINTLPALRGQPPTVTTSPR